MTAGHTAGHSEQAGRGYLRASDADREQVVDALKAAFVHGLLSKEELGMRAGQALGARTLGDLAAITAGIPARPARGAGARPTARSSPRPATARPATARRGRRPPQARKKLVAWTACVVLPPAIGAAFLTYYGGFIVLFVLTFLGAVLTAGPVDTARRNAR